MGDICKFLSDKKGTNGSKLNKSWVMPKSELWDGDEWGSYYSLSTTPTAVNDVWYVKNSDWTSGLFTSLHEDGTGYSAALMTFTTAANESATFPASGYRYDVDGALDGVGYGGYYWSSSVSGASGAYGLHFFSDEVGPASNFVYRAIGLSVRCVQEL
jgi:hypothetical protein